MKKLHLATNVSLPIDALMQPIALLGNRGSGKTYGLTKLFELAHDAGVQCVAVDVISKLWGLRLGADGKSPGLEDVYIFGGRHGDVPLKPEQGAFVAKVIVERHIHAVLDVALMRKGERRRFLTDFFEEFYLLKKQVDVPQPCVVFIEEAHAVAPQRPQPDEARMLGAVEDLVREGRNAGIGVVLDDQRPATVNKNVLALTEVLIALRTTFTSDRKVYEEWIEQKVDEGMEEVDLPKELPFLKAGEGFLYAPTSGLFERVKILPKQTYDSTATTKVGGKKLGKVGTLSPVDLKSLGTAMESVVAEAKASDPKALRAKVAELEARLAFAVAAQPQVKTETRTVEKKALKGPELARLEKVMTRLEALKTSSDAAHHVFKETATALAMELQAIRTAEALELAKATRPMNGNGMIAPGHYELKRLEPKPTRKFEAVTVTGGQPSDYAMVLLTTLRRRHPMLLTRAQISTLSNRRPRSSAFAGAMAEMVKGGWAEVKGGLFGLSQQGLQLFNGGEVTVPQTADEVQGQWRNALSPYERSFFDSLVAAYPQGCTRAELAEYTRHSITSSAFSGAISSLVRNGLAEVSDGSVFASSSLFP